MQFIYHYEIHLKTMYLQNINSLRKKSKYVPQFRLFYKPICKKKMYIPKKKTNLYQFILAVEKYRITNKNIYNFDKKGLIIDIDIILYYNICSCSYNIFSFNIPKRIKEFEKLVNR